jgi:putative membrane-bound dehydrogenase-like protein
VFRSRFLLSALLVLGGLPLLTSSWFSHADDRRARKALAPPTPAAVQPVAAEAPPAGDKKFDFNQPQSPTLPAPAGLTFIDQGSNDPRLKGYRTPAGFKLEIVAEEPTVVNPVGMTFANDGTPYVLEWRPSPGDEWKETPVTFTYKDGSTRLVATMKKRVKDVVKTLADSKGKGIYDKSTTILEEELPSSILLHDGWLYLSGRGSIRRYRQSKPDGPYDVKQVIAHGFCGFHHHQVSGMTIGNDGLLYVTSGDDDNRVEGSDGSRATVLRTGAVFRCRPDGSRMETFAIGFRNPYRDVVFDAAGNMFHADNDNEDGSKFMGCRLMHIAEGCDFGWRLFQGARCCRPDLMRGAVYGELPGKVPPLLKTGRGSPAGLLLYNDTRLPEAYRGWMFYPDVFRQLIRAYRVSEDGATFRAAEEFEFLKAPGDKLFRPCQMVLGPDGAMYIVDWRTDSGGAGKLWGDGVHGRIYRVSWSGTKDEPALPLRKMDSWAGFGKLSDEALIGSLESAEASFREKARIELVRRGEKNRKALIKEMLDSEKSNPVRIAALGVLQSMWDDSVQKAFLSLLATGDSDLRRLAADGLGLNAAHGDKEVQDGLLKALTEDDRATKRAVVMAISRIGGPGAADALASTLSFDEGEDVYLRDGIVRALENLGKPGVDALISVADSGVGKNTDKVVQAFMAFRRRAGYEGLPAILKNQHLSPAQQAALVKSASNYLLDPPVSLDPIVTWLTGQPKLPTEVKLAGLEMLGTPGRPGEHEPTTG